MTKTHLIREPLTPTLTACFTVMEELANSKKSSREMQRKLKMDSSTNGVLQEKVQEVNRKLTKGKGTIRQLE